MKNRPDRETERALAERYEEQMGDVSGWKRIPGPFRSRRGGPSSVFSVRFLSGELSLLQRAAEQEGTTVSAFVRDAAIEAAQPRYVLHFAAGGQAALHGHARDTRLKLPRKAIA